MYICLIDINWWKCRHFQPHIHLLIIHHTQTPTPSRDGCTVFNTQRTVVMWCWKCTINYICTTSEWYVTVHLTMKIQVRVHIPKPSVSLKLCTALLAQVCFCVLRKHLNHDLRSHSCPGVVLTIVRLCAYAHYAFCTPVSIVNNKLQVLTQKFPQGSNNTYQLSCTGKDAAEYYRVAKLLYSINKMSAK